MSESENESSYASNSDYVSSDEDSTTNWYTIDPTRECINDPYMDTSILEDILMGDMLKICEGVHNDTGSIYLNNDTCNDDVYFNEQTTQCTYSEGYMKRQNIYTCVDCNDKNCQLSALCFACAMCCHRKHNIIELCSKRNYRCDCGNEKFGKFNCKLYPDKELFNSKNIYNDNFRGVYCVCKQPYESDTKEENDMMIQCVICEDWYHTKHLDVEPPKDAEGKCTFDEFICFLCSSQYAYLTKYGQIVLESTKNNENNDNTLSTIDKTTITTITNTIKICANNNNDKNDNTNNNVNKDTNNVEKCKIKTIPVKLPYTSLYMPTGWRNLLCRCVDCYKTYEHHEHLYLLDKDDLLANDNAGSEVFAFVRSLVDTPILDDDINIDNHSLPQDTTSTSLNHLNTSISALPLSSVTVVTTTVPNDNNNNHNINSTTISNNLNNNDKDTLPNKSSYRNSSTTTAPPITNDSNNNNTNTSNTENIDNNNNNNNSLSPNNTTTNNMDDFLNGIFNKKRPVKLHDSNEVVQEYQRKKRPKYDDENQNL